MNMPTCPTAERWKAHLDGTLPPEEQSALTAHLDECASCQKTLEQVAAGGDSLLDVARQVGNENAPPSITPHVIPDDATQADTANAASNAGDLDFLAPPTKPEHLGRLGHYEVHEVIGKGGFGVVLKAFDEKLHRIVAIKVLAPGFANNGSARERFIREARTAAAIKNEHVVGIYDVERDAQPPYLAMEMIDGVSLQDKIDKHGPLGLKEILRIGMQMAEGLAAAHKQGLVHRDIKPSNILLENGVERVKITDFGLARAVDDASVTQSGTVAGTPMYMSPEQAEGLPIDHRSDLFSLGTVLYAMCTGHPPFRASGTHAVLKRVIDAAPRPIREINNEIPDWLCHIIAKLHAKKPEDRYQSAQEVAELFAACVRALQANHKLKDFARLAGAPPARKERASKSAALALIPVVLLVALVAIVVLLRKPSNDGTNAAKQKSGVLSLRLSDVAIQYRIDGHGANQTGVGVMQMPLEAGQHKVWFTLGDRQFETFPFTIDAGKTSELALEVTPERGSAIFNGQPLDLTKIGNHGEWVQLFNGANLAGWKTHPEQSGDWRVEQGILIGHATKPSHLFTDRGDYENFHFRVEAKISAGGDSGQFFRCEYGFHDKDSKDRPKGYEANISFLNEFNTGSLWGAGWPPIGPKENPITADTWFTQEVIAVGNHIVIKVNGKTTVDIVDDRYRRGHLALQAWAIGTVVYFRKIEIKELPAPAPALAAADVLKHAVLLMNFEKDTFYQKDGKTYVRDLSGNGNDGLCEKVGFTPNGKAGGGLACQGGQLRLAKSLVERQPNYTITAWCRWDEITPDQHYLYLTCPEENADAPIFSITIPPQRSVRVNAWNLRREPDAWLGVESPPHALPEQGWYFVAVSLEDGDLNKGTLHVTIDDRHFTFNSQRMEGHLPSHVDLMGLGMAGAVIDELTVFQRTLSAAEIASLRRAGVAGQPLAKPAAETGWVQLFNGTNLAGWTNPKKDLTRWKVEQGVLVGKGDQAFLRSERGPFGDFHLRMEAKYVGGTAGLVVREQSPDVAGGGYECLMENHQDGDFNTGAVAQMLTKSAMGPVAVPKKVTTQEDKWFTLEIIASGNRVQTFVDGKKAVDFVDINNEYKDGFIALNVRGEQGELHVKKIEVKELPSEERGWVQLFNGVDYDGWTPTPRNKWTVKNGALVGVGRGTLTTGRQYGNFHCRMKAKFSADSLGSVIVGNQADVRAEVRIGDKHAAATTGSLLLYTKPKTETIVAWDKNAIPPDTWFELEIVLRDKQVTVKVNGTTTADQRLEKLPAGFSHIGLHADQPGTVITVSKIEIRELPPGTQ